MYGKACLVENVSRFVWFVEKMLTVCGVVSWFVSPVVG